MAFLNKLGDLKNKALEATNGATSAIKSTISQAKENYKQMNEEAKQKDLEQRELASTLGNEIINGILQYCDGSKGGFFSNISEEELLDFTKNFYEKLVLPGGKTSQSCLNMHPYIDEKQVKKFANSFSKYDINEKPVLYIKDNDKQEILLTTKLLYFRKPVEAKSKYFADGVVEVGNIDVFSMNENEPDYFSFMCDTYELAKIKLAYAYKQDFISLNDFFKCIKSREFAITDKKIDKLIYDKIGDKIYTQVKKYMTYEDELLLFYAGGLDSLTAVDYVACTTNQIIIVDREMFGATANVKQYYYEDITAMATIQNSQSTDLLANIIDSALTSAFKLCDLEISVAGSKNKISTLNSLEAQRVISIYHERRKMAKEASKQPQIIQQFVQQEKQPDIMEQLEKLAKLKDAGILTEDEFNGKKQELLSRM